MYGPWYHTKLSNLYGTISFAIEWGRCLHTPPCMHGWYGEGIYLGLCKEIAYAAFDEAEAVRWRRIESVDVGKLYFCYCSWNQSCSAMQAPSINRCHLWLLTVVGLCLFYFYLNWLHPLYVHILTSHFAHHHDMSLQTHSNPLHRSSDGEPCTY